MASKYYLDMSRLARQLDYIMTVTRGSHLALKRPGYPTFIVANSPKSKDASLACTRHRLKKAKPLLMVP